MFRWLAVCLVLAAGAFAVVFLLTPKTEANPRKSPGNHANESPRLAPDEGRGRPSDKLSEIKIKTFDPVAQALKPRAEEPFLVVQGGKIQADLRQEVPAEKDGKLVFIGAELTPEEAKYIDGLKAEFRKTLPADARPTEAQLIAAMEKQGKLPRWYIPVEVGFLAIEIKDGETVTLEEQYTLPTQPGKRFRRWRETDDLLPGTVMVARELKGFRKLEEGDTVYRGQLLAMVNPAIALDDMAIKAANLDAADADRKAARKTKEEAHKRWQGMERANRLAQRAIADDDVRAAQLAYERYMQEEIAKAAAVKKGQRELSAAVTTLKMHEIRSSIPGVVKSLYKNMGDSVKNLDAVLQLQDPTEVRIEARVEVQDAERLKPGMDVLVEVPQADRPAAVLTGHRQEVTSVAVTRGKQPFIVSGSEDGTVRVWERVSGSEGWRTRRELSHGEPVRAVACTPESAANNLLLTATASGVARLFDLDQEYKQTRLQGRHSGPVNSAAFSPNGQVCATGGEDRSICLWNTQDGKRYQCILGAHKSPVTGLQFVDEGRRLISTGRDNRLVVWNVEKPAQPVQVSEFTNRSNDVAQLGASPDGKHVLFDQGRQLSILSVADGQLEGTLQNPPGSVNFATLALFSPDGKTIMTNGNGPGRLQLWRAPTAFEADQGRGSPVREWIWTGGMVTCGAFAPGAPLAVTGTQDHQVLVWSMPSEEDVKRRLTARLIYVEGFVEDTQKRVAIKAELKNPGWLRPGTMTATIVVPKKKQAQ